MPRTRKSYNVVSMLNRKMVLRTSLLVLAAAVLLLVFAPNGAAQGNTASSQLSLGTIVDPEPITPDLGSATISVPWTYSIPQQGFQLSQLATSTATLQWDPAQCPQGVTITGSFVETIVLTEGTPQQNSWSGTSTFNVQVSLQAPGESPLPCTIQGRVLPIAGVSESNPAGTQVNVRAAYLGLLSVNTPTTIAQAGPQKQIRYDLQIANLGNSETNVRFNLITEEVGRWDPVIPTQVLLASPAKSAEGTTQTVSFQISTPFKNGWNNDQKTFQLEVSPVSTKDIDDVGQPVTVTVLARVRGVYVPTLEPMLAIGGLAAAAFVARRARQD